MMHTSPNEKISCSMLENGRFRIVIHQPQPRQFSIPGDLFSLILRKEQGQEIHLCSAHQDPPHILAIGTILNIFYPRLRTDTEDLDIKLFFTMALENEHIRMSASLENNSEYAIASFRSIAVPESSRRAPQKKGNALHMPPRIYQLTDLEA